MALARSGLRRCALAVIGVVLAVPTAAAADWLSADESDPTKLGWMQGFPPPADKQIGQPDSNYFSFPKLR